MELKQGKLLHGGTYRIEQMLGQGSFGITYLAVHTALDKKVAIKEFFMKEINGRGDDGSITGMSDGSLSMNYARKFQKEALNLARLEHSNIVRVTDSFEDNGTFYYVMDYIEGENLNDYVKHHNVSQQEAVDIIRDVANALMYMHEEKHMLHLDLKPGNIMRRSSDGHIFLIDFGLSKHYSNNGRPETSTTIGLGTPGYAPIEQANQAKNGEFRPTIDIYALGATFYKLLTRETPPAASELVSDDELLADSLKQHNINDHLAKVVINAMLPSVRERTLSVKDFLASLNNNVTNATSDDMVVPPTNDKEATINRVSSEDETKVENSSNIGEETVFAKDSPKRHPDFDESKYVIKTDYKKFPTSTKHKADNGDRDAVLALGIMALRAEDFDTAHAWFLKLKNLGDDRGDKLINDWYKLKDKYKKTSKDHSHVVKKKDDNNNNIIAWIIGLIVVIIVPLFSIKSRKEKRDAEEKVRIESIVRNMKDWYGAGNGQFYCMVEGKMYFVRTYDIPDGQRTIHYSSGDTFVGTFKGGRKSKGKYTYKNGDYFDGTFSYGSKETGYGKETSYDGSHVYEGNYQNGMWNGAGTEMWPKEKRKNWGCMLECTYKDNQRHGIGTWYYNNHTYEKVRFKNGKMTQRNIEEGTWK